MTDQDKKQFAMMMGGLSAAFRCDSNKETMAIYFQYLGDYSIEAVRFAVDKAITTGERFPVVAKLREQASLYRPPETRKPMIPEYQIEEFSAEEMAKYSKYESADDFFSEMLGEVSEGMAV